jgi:hypothetical protein
MTVELQTRVATSVASSEAFGRPTPVTVMRAAGIASAERFGAGRQVVTAAGVPSAAAVGLPPRR